MSLTSDSPSSTVVALPLSGVGFAPAVSPELVTAAQGVSQLFPRAGVVSTITARFEFTAAPIAAPAVATMSAQLYTGPANSDVLTPVPGSTCTLSPTFGPQFVPVGSIGTCTLSTNIPIAAGTQGAIVFAVTDLFPDSFTGLASASMSYA